MPNQISPVKQYLTVLHPSVVSFVPKKPAYVPPADSSAAEGLPAALSLLLRLLEAPLLLQQIQSLNTVVV